MLGTLCTGRCGYAPSRCNVGGDTEASPRRRTWAGLAGFAAIEIAAFVRYTDIVILGCAVVTVIVAWRLRAEKLPLRTLCCWLASVAVFGTGRQKRYALQCNVGGGIFP